MHLATFLRPLWRKFRKFSNLYLIIFFLTASIGWVTQTLIPITLPSSEKPIEFFAQNNPTKLKEVVFAAINQAKTSIHLLVYTLTDRDVIARLREKSEDGVEVTVTVDSKANKGLSKLLGPKVALKYRAPLGIMHCKALIIDGHTSWIGSANFTKESLTLHSNIIVGYESAPLADYLIAKIRSMPETGASKTTTPAHFMIGSQSLEFWFTPQPTLGPERIIHEIAHASRSVKIAMFTWTHPDLRKAVVEAKRRGVDVTVVIDRNSGSGVSAETVHFLKEGGVKVLLSGGVGLLHEKMAIIDESTLIQGSLNWTRAAFKQNEDCFTILKELTPSQTAFLQGMWNDLLKGAEEQR